MCKMVQIELEQIHSPPMTHAAAAAAAALASLALSLCARETAWSEARVFSSSLGPSVGRWYPMKQEIPIF